MIIVAGSLEVEAAERAAYLDNCVAAVEQAHNAPGCLAFALGADIVDASRINVYERWESESDLMAFRQSGPDDEQQSSIKDASVRRYEVASEGPA